MPAGGTASTSGVTEAFTSTGGQSGLIDTSQNSCSGGGESGNPFVTAAKGASGLDSNGFMGGGGGWCDDDPTGTLNQGNNYEYIQGGNGTMQIGNLGSFFAQQSIGKGGNGVVGRGGYSFWAENNSASSKGISIPASNGESNYWWFPWEIAGGGGGAAAIQNSNFMIAAGHGGCGGGGGACNANSNNVWAYGGGMGGFGGGGGAARS